MQQGQFLKILAEAIRQKRKEMGISQVSACREIGVDYRHYQNIEGGKINMRIDTMLLLMQFYKISMAIFFEPTQTKEQ